jgi:hypothetical protein
VRTRPGLPPAVASSVAATWVATPCLARNPSGAAWVRSSPGAASSRVISAASTWWRRAAGAIAALTPAAGAARSRGRNRAAASTCRPRGSPASCRRTCPGAVRIRSRRGWPAWVRAVTAPARATRSARTGLHQPVAALRHAGRLAAPGGQRGRHRVGGTALAALPAGLAVRPDHPGHLHAAGGQVAGQPGTVAAGALHPHLGQLAMRAQPRQRSPVPGRISRKRPRCPAPGPPDPPPRPHARPRECPRPRRRAAPALRSWASPLLPRDTSTARGRGTTPPAGTRGPSTSGTPKVRLPPGHERPGRRLPHPPAGQWRCAAASHETI